MKAVDDAVGGDARDEAVAVLDPGIAVDVADEVDITRRIERQRLSLRKSPDHRDGTGSSG